MIKENQCHCPSSSRNVGMRDIGAVPHLYSALQACGMTKCAARGFTLMEILIVVLIIGILAAIALPQYQQAVLKAQYATLMPAVEALAQAEEVYYLTNGTYTNRLKDLDISVPLTCNEDPIEKSTTTCNNGPFFRVGSEYVLGTMIMGNKAPLYYMVYYRQHPSLSGKRVCGVNSKFASVKKYHKVCQSLGGALDRNSGRTYYLN